jgi:sigma-E factor negative regulatory protein RseC
LITEKGKVVAIDDDGLWVETLNRTSCAQCSAKSGCGQRLLGEYGPFSAMTLIKVNFAERQSASQWALGEQAILGMDERALVNAALLLYGLPLLGLVFGTWFGYVIGAGTEPATVLGAVSGLALVAVAVKTALRQKKLSAFFQAKIVGKGVPAVPAIHSVSGDIA